MKKLIILFVVLLIACSNKPDEQILNYSEGINTINFKHTCATDKLKNSLIPLHTLVRKIEVINYVALPDENIGSVYGVAKYNCNIPNDSLYLVYYQQINTIKEIKGINLIVIPTTANYITYQESQK